jgi:hypothetical protein
LNVRGLPRRLARSHAKQYNAHFAPRLASIPMGNN